MSVETSGRVSQQLNNGQSSRPATTGGIPDPNKVPPTPPPPSRTRSMMAGEIAPNAPRPDEDGYVHPVDDPYHRAIKYLEKHNVLQLFQNITAGIVFNRPQDPIQFMIDEVEKLKSDEKYQTSPDVES